MNKKQNRSLHASALQITFVSLSVVLLTLIAAPALAQTPTPTPTPPVNPNLYAILDTGTVGSIVHNVVSIDYSVPNSISYVPFGTIAGFPDKYFVSATLDPILCKIFFALSDSPSRPTVINIYLYSVTFPDLSTITPFCISNTVYINLNPQLTYNVTNNLFYYAINNDPLGYNYGVNTIDSNGNIVVTNINTSNLQNSSNGLQIFNDYIYATLRPGNSFTVYYGNLNDNTTGSITSPITPQPPGQIWSVFDSNGVLWGTTQIDASSPPSYSLYKLECTTAGAPASNPFLSELIGNMPTTFDGNAIANLTLFTPATQTPTPTPTPTATATATSTPSGVCPLGQGYWKNHPNAWPVNTVMLGNQTYTKAELLNILNNPGRGDASMILAVQLIAAKLNIANGSDPTPVASTITHADSLLSIFTGKLSYKVKPSSAIGQMMVNDGNTLDNYISGQLPPHCSG